MILTVFAHIKNHILFFHAKQARGYAHFSIFVDIFAKHENRYFNSTSRIIRQSV